MGYCRVDILNACVTFLVERPRLVEQAPLQAVWSRQSPALLPPVLCQWRPARAGPSVRHLAQFMAPKLAEMIKLPYREFQAPKFRIQSLPWKTIRAILQSKVS